MSVQRIVIVTDSSAYIPNEAKEGLNILVIPLWLIWEEEHFQDGIDITPSSFYRRLKESKTLPTSSQPSVKEFELFFRQAATDADAIVSVLVSSKISGTFASAEAAVTNLPELDIRLVDSPQASMGHGLCVLAAAKMVEAGGTVEDAVHAAEEMRDKVNLIFMVDTLEYLHRGGRISGGKRLLGTALQIKPLLHFEGGEIRPLSQARTKRKALNKLLEIAADRIGSKRMVEAVIVDIDNPQDGQILAYMVKERFNLSRVLRAEVSPVVGTHVGPGSLGIAFYA